MVELTYDILDILEYGQKERAKAAKRDKETWSGRPFGAATVSDGLLVTNGDWIFCFEDVASSKIARQLLSACTYPLNKLKDFEHWEEGMNSFKGCSRIPVTEDKAISQSIAYRTRRGQVFYMGAYYHSIMKEIVPHPAISVCIPTDSKTTEYRGFFIYEGKVLRGIISNRVTP